MILFALENTCGQLFIKSGIQTLKREKSMTSSLKQVKSFSDPKMINGFATVKNSCGQLFVV